MPRWKREEYMDASGAWRMPDDDYIDYSGCWRTVDERSVEKTGRSIYRSFRRMEKLNN